LGRGRGANRWWSADGALTFSLIIDAGPIPAERRPLVSLVAGGAVCEIVAAALPAADVRLKWPNDVYVAGRKAGGILVEVPHEAPDLLVIGIGLNVNVSLRDAPEDVQQRATALCDVTGEILSINEILVAALHRLEFDLGRLDS